MELETSTEWTGGDICDDKRKVELAATVLVIICFMFVRTQM